MIRFFKFALLVFVTLSLIGSNTVVFAKGKGKGASHSGAAHGKKEGWKGEGHPPGWKHGKKKGWHGADQPPGLAKKEAGKKTEE